MVTEMSDTEQTSRNPVTVLGLGGGGGRIVDALSRCRSGRGLRLAAADTDQEALACLGGDIERIPLGSDWTHRTGAGGDMGLGERAAGATAEGLRNAFDGSRLALVVVGLGGGTGSGASKVVARMAEEMDLTTFFVATLPFSFEGNWPHKQAEQALDGLRQVTDAVVVVPNDLLFTSLSADTPAGTAFATADRLLAESLDGLSRIVSGRALLPVDFASLRGLIRNRQCVCALGVGRASGEQRWQKALEAFLHCPLTGGPEELRRADGAVLTLLGGPDLTLGEMQTCLGELQRFFPAHARVVKGAHTDDALEGQIQITGVVCRYASAPGSPRKQPVERESHERKGGRRRRKAAASELQGELPLEEHSLGIFAETHPTTFRGQNLDIPTFQRRGIQLDVGD